MTSLKKNAGMGWAFGAVAKGPLGMATSPFRVPGFKFWLCFYFQISANANPGSASTWILAFQVEGQS